MFAWHERYFCPCGVSVTSGSAWLNPCMRCGYKRGQYRTVKRVIVWRGIVPTIMFVDHNGTLYR